MFKRIVSRTMVSLKAGWKGLLTPLALIVAAVVYAFVVYKPAINGGPLQRFMPQPVAQVATSSCDYQLMALFAGQPGDDASLYDCLSQLPNGPKDVAEVTQVRTIKANQKTEFKRVGDFTTDGRQQSGGTAVVYVLRDSYPETVMTIYLTPDGHVQGIG